MHTIMHTTVHANLPCTIKTELFHTYFVNLHIMMMYTSPPNKICTIIFPRQVKLYIRHDGTSCMPRAGSGVEEALEYPEAPVNEAQ